MAQATELRTTEHTAQRGNHFIFSRTITMIASECDLADYRAVRRA